MPDKVENFISDLLNKITECHSNREQKTFITQGESNSEFYANRDYILQRLSEELSDSDISIEKFEVGKISISIKTKFRT